MKAKFNGILTLLLALTVQFVFAQKTVSGTVTDETGPLPGVNIIIKGTTTGTETDFDGNYSIQAKQGDVLVFSYVGMGTVERTVGTSNIIDVQMKASDENILEEVVVTAFGKKKTKNEFTGSVVSVESQEITKSSMVSTEQALQGHVAGLKVNTTSGTPGSNQQISIRGMQSINASTNPLVIVDGVYINQENLSGSTAISSLSPLAYIKSEDIESISVLKDAISTAPYGAAGANGVIMITTKSGKYGKTKYSLNNSIGFNNNASRGLVPLTGEQKLDLIKEGMWNTYGPNGQQVLSSKDQVDSFVLSNLSRARTWVNSGSPVYNWEDEIAVKNAMLMNTDFSVSSGNEKSNFYASVGYNNTASTVIGAGFERLSGMIKYGTDLNEKIRLNLSLNGSNSTQDASLEQSAYFSNPNLTRYFMSPWINPFEEDGTPNITSISNQTSVHNTLFTNSVNYRKNNVTRVAQGTDLTIDLLENLVFNTKLNFEYNINAYHNYQSPLHGDGKASNGYVEQSDYKVFNYTTQNSLDYKFNLGEKNKFGFTALSEFVKFKNNYLYGYGENLPNTTLQNLSATTAAQESFASKSDRMAVRYVGLLSYAYNQKYLVDASYSYQGDSRFSPETRYDHFYSFGLGWNLHKEDFFRNIDAINELRLKASYGITGNAGIDRNEYQALFNFTDYNDNPASLVSKFGSVGVTWEKGLKRDLALEYKLFNSRWKGTFAYFSNLTYDMLFYVPMALSEGYYDAGSGAAEYITNGGDMTNKGFELETAVDVVRGDSFNWNVRGNFATVETMVTKVRPENETNGTNVIMQDHILYEWNLPLWKGVNPDNGLPEWYTDETKTTVTNTYSQAERVFIGKSPQPKYTGGLSTRFDIKNFFVEGGLYFAGGHKIYESWAAYTQTSNASRIYTFTATNALYEGVWREPGDIATHPRMEWSNSVVANSTLTSTRFLYDGDYIRLRDVALGYTFGKNQFKNLFFDSVTLTLRGTNLLTWVKDDRLKYDPEVREDGFTNLTTPPIKTVLFNINLNF